MWKLFLRLVLVGALVGCQKPEPPSAGQASAGALQKITVACPSPDPQSTLVLIAAAKGFFLEEGLEADLLVRPYGKLALQSVLDRQADFATVAETPIMFSVLKGEKILVLASIASSNMNEAVVARKEAGISVPGELKGKRIGYVPGTTSEFFMEALLTAHGLMRSDIEPVAINPDQMQEALMTGQIDAASTWNYSLTRIKQALGTGGIIFYDPQIHTGTFNVAARQDYVLENPQAVKKLLRALIKAEAFAQQNPDEAQAILSADFKIDKSLIQSLWQDYDYQVLLDQKLLIALEDETRWAIKNKLTEQTVMPDYAAFIHLDALKAVKPAAVKTVR